MNNAGKTITIFAVLMVVILLSSTCIGFYLYHKETNDRKTVEADLQIARDAQTKSQADIADLKKQVTLLKDKNKEADEKINSLLDEIELNEGVRKELKKENDGLKTQVEGFNKAKEKAKTDLDEAEKKLKELQDLLNAEKDRSKELAKQVETWQAKLANAQQATTPEPKAPAPVAQKVELDKIVVNPNESSIKGRIVSIDKDTEFVICNLGVKQGIKSADVLSVYRGEEYLGDVKVTRVQEQLCAADLIPPFSINKIRKNDIVMVKPE